MKDLLVGAAGAAIVTGIFGVATWALNRMAAKKDAKDAKDDKVSQDIEKLRTSVIDLDNLVRELKTEMNAQIGQLRYEQEENKMISIRARTLRFADEIQHGENHSEEHYKQIVSDISSYEIFCLNNTKFKNSLMVISSKIVKENYEKKIKENSFLV